MANKEKKEDRSAFQPSIFEPNPERERQIFEFPPGTPIWRSGGGLVYAEKTFLVEQMPGKVSGYGAFKLVKDTLVYRQRGWEAKSYFHLQVGEFVGLVVSKTHYKPKKLR